MTDSDIPPTITDEQRVLSDLYHEAQLLEEPQRSEQIAAVADLAGDITLSELVQIRELDEELRQADEAQRVAAGYIARARELAHTSSKEEHEKQTVKQAINFDKIEWMQETGIKEVEAKEVDQLGVRYKFINLIGHHRLTNDLYEELEEQSVHGHAHLGEKLLEEVEQIVIPKLDQGIRMGRNVRPVTSGGKSKAKAAKSLKTSYPGYKEGVHSSKNRVIILKVDEPGSEIPAYAVVALFDHDDDGDIYRTLFRSTK